jgi:DNA polymerase-4
MGNRLHDLARGEDRRPVHRDAPMKSISAETTFNEDTAARPLLDGHLWRLAERVTDRAKARDLAGRTVTLKLRRGDFATITRRRTLREPSQSVDALYQAGAALLADLRDPGPFRLIGIGLSDLCPAAAADLTGDLLDPGTAARRRAEKVTDEIRARFGADAILRGRALN